MQDILQVAKKFKGQLSPDVRALIMKGYNATSTEDIQRMSTQWLKDMAGIKYFELLKK